MIHLAKIQVQRVYHKIGLNWQCIPVKFSKKRGLFPKLNRKFKVLSLDFSWLSCAVFKQHRIGFQEGLHESIVFKLNYCAPAAEFAELLLLAGSAGVVSVVA